ncbi:Phosphomethylpyrimidine kinase-domain-containing protein [Radiomyces spectabilis]|uniref:Phosphomethylpyrimidine kinase-domain-containing protein n=1 Tax=Radiomyces spectabilis TaxID=64574 RepID=UPI00221FE150|nr:Phosphomethylpyrimidine kinase-domain-containing protein [Radiomyces spectabilis]KAI8377831.1 Phosphomethylpyrimidine kinase-domain-containing protein [Radiomyces spectabilis]
MTTTVSEKSIPRALTIAGSDSGGGAGIQADLKTFTSLHVYGTSVVAALTSQNTLGVDAIHDVPVEFVQKQLEAVLSDIGTDAVKTGMLSSAAIITAVVQTLKKYPEAARHIVVDPVMVATSGSRLLAADATQAYISELLPITYLLTPNVPEAEVLLGQQKNSIQSVQDMHAAARKLGEMGPKYVLLKGGHLPVERENGKKVVDVLYESSTGVIKEFVNPYVDTKNTHGTGCTLSSAIAAELAKGKDAFRAVVAGTTYIQDAIQDSLGCIGKGSGPINHFHNVRWMPYEGKSFVEALKSSLPTGVWDQFIDHPFVRGMADGTLPKENFIFYIKQDYLYLQHYARAAALAAYKSADIEMCARNAKIVIHIHQEMQLHLKYCEKWGISKEEVLATPESVFNVAYTRYVLDKGATGDQLDLQVAMAPCLIGYGEIGMKLYNDPNTKREGNPYWTWIENYAEGDYQEAVRTGRNIMEELAQHNVSTSPTRFREVCNIFEAATKLEIEFWEMGLQMR